MVGSHSSRLPPLEQDGTLQVLQSAQRGLKPVSAGGRACPTPCTGFQAPLLPGSCAISRCNHVLPSLRGLVAVRPAAAAVAVPAGC